ncbi:EAL domain-containing protein [Clostridium beijerinckii]|uniref:EAL domain-containing protein n=1 Tax=Clostridium beijerinckii TaxID=1520 RepID=UPI000809B04C|nr:EAL domain-containing protein [Clostridium beijerinckii]OCA99071.1 diguanylate cyclase [Clostridium beijerinckii]
MKLTFRLKLFFYFVGIILSISIPIALITYNYMYKSLKEHLFSSAKAQMVQVDNNFSNMLGQIKYNAKFLATYSDAKKADQSISALFNIPDIAINKKYSKQMPGIEGTIYNVLEAYGTSHPETTYVYIGTKWGGYIQWPDGLSTNTFDPRTRPWYSLALSNPDEVVISDPYVSAVDNSKNVIISASTTVKNEDGSIVGVMGIDLSLEKLSEIIRNIRIGDTGYVFLYLKDGTMLAHPDIDLNFKNILHLNQLGYTYSQTNESSKFTFDNYDKFIDLDNGSFETYINGNPVLVNVYTCKDTGWKMASVIPKSELESKASKMGYLIIMITVGVLFLAIFVTLIVTKKVTKPITELVPLMQAAGNGDLSVKASINSNDEFGKLGRSFNLMIGKLCSSYEELSSVYEELLATEEELRVQYKELQQNEEALRVSEEKYKLALECANDSIWEWNLVTDTFFASDKLIDITGYKLDEINNLRNFVYENVHLDDLDKVKKDFKNHINQLTDVYSSEFRIRTKSSSYVWILSCGKALRDSQGKVIKITGSIRDISERKISEDRIKFMAFYDSLTKLPNRTLFMNRLNEQLQLSNYANKQGIVFFIDLDNFKNINDTMGHEYGDKLLISLAKQFENLIEEKDTISRLGGDEFILLHPDSKEDEIQTYANRLLGLFDKVFKIDNKHMYITASVGIALYPKDGRDSSTILRNADAAMYRAKELGKNRFSLFDPQMYLSLERKTSIERILRTAVDNNELIINYQPQYDLQANKIFGFEALLRLNSRELGFVSPAEFIPIAEESGYITQLTLWVLKESCKQSAKWFEAGYKFNSISVNISSVDLQEINFLDNVKEIIESSSVDPNMIELEITETVLMKSFDSSIEILKKLMDMGIRIALDDFGTGYSSLSYLRRIPINTLKIDKSFIDNISSNKKEEAIIKNIIQMAHSMELKVIAEGVEVEDQLLILKRMKCDYIQGYYFSKPLLANQLEELLEK